MFELLRKSETILMAFRMGATTIPSEILLLDVWNGFLKVKNHGPHRQQR